MTQPQPHLHGAHLLADLRRGASLTQVELAKRAGISRSMVAQLEMGERRPSQKLIRALCQAMQASEEQERQLFLAYDFRPTGETPEQIAAFLRADKNLSPDQAERLAQLIRQLYQSELDRE